MARKKFSASLAPKIKKVINNLDNRDVVKRVKVSQSKKPSQIRRPHIFVTTEKGLKAVSQLKKPRMINSDEPLLEKNTVIKNGDLHFKIGGSYFQRDVFGKTIQVGALTCETSIMDMGKKKTCPRCKQEFFTGRHHSQVICPECKEKIKTHPKIYTKVCPICHEEYSSRRNDAQTCSKDSCRKSLYRQKKRSNSSPLF